ncbi:MAG: IMPACT family protein [Defluviitaleaceae bacterium]|nr:IMPACT family protein [Defluviitaleaceae bacterium]
MPLILPKAGVFEYEEKRSKFLGYCAPIKSEEEARRIIAEIRTAHPRANHNVFAYGVRAGNILRMSDDGEPHGTAGMPVLNVFEKSGVIDYVCVVTRYFGGTLLGAGGLVRAYTRAAKGAMENAAPEELIIHKMHSITCAYSNFDKVKYEFEKNGIEILETVYTDICTITVRVKEADSEKFEKIIKNYCP